MKRKRFSVERIAAVLKQAHDNVPRRGGRGYMVNVASYKNGVGYSKWIHTDGWSELVVEYIRELEQLPLA